MILTQCLHLSIVSCAISIMLFPVRCVLLLCSFIIILTHPRDIMWTTTLFVCWHNQPTKSTSCKKQLIIFPQIIGNILNHSRSRTQSSTLKPTRVGCLNISRTAWNVDFTKSMSSGEGEREEVVGGSSYLWNSDMFDELLTRVGPRITKHNTNYREALDPGLKLSLTLRHLVSGTKYHSMSYGWRVPHNTISLLIPKVCQAIIDE